jgi:hypothetical protein
MRCPAVVAVVISFFYPFRWLDPGIVPMPCHGQWRVVAASAQPL